MGKNTPERKDSIMDKLVVAVEELPGRWLGCAMPFLVWAAVLGAVFEGLRA